MTVTASLSITLEGQRAGSNPNGKPNFPFVLSDRADFLPGAAAGQANDILSAERTIAASGFDDLDLNGAFPGVFGANIAFTLVRAIMVIANPANINNVVIGGAPANGFVGPFGAAAHTIVLRPGEEFVITNRGAGWPVTPGTADLLRIANSGAGSTVSYKIAILGS